ncbi:MAG: heme-binding protein [Promethearchaeota archaeon]
MNVIVIILIVLLAILSIWFAWGLISPHIWEQPEYDILKKLDKVEIRNYKQSKILTTRASTSSYAFSKLSSYIFGKNKEKEKIAMTAPVLTEAIENNKVKMVFYLPKKYEDKDAPTPLMDDIETENQDERNVAILRFYGTMTHKRKEKNIEKLLGTLNENNIETQGSLFFLNYSDPFVPPPLRRNEVGIEVNLK